MSLNPVQSILPNHLAAIVEHLDIDLASHSKVQDTCFLAVWEHCQQHQWDVILSLKTSITQLVDSLGQSILGYSIVEASTEKDQQNPLIHSSFC